MGTQAESVKVFNRAIEPPLEVSQTAFAPALHLFAGNMVELRFPMRSAALQQGAYMAERCLGSGDVEGKVAEQAFVHEAHAVIDHAGQAR